MDYAEVRDALTRPLPDAAALRALAGRVIAEAGVGENEIELVTLARAYLAERERCAGIAAGTRPPTGRTPLGDPPADLI